MTDEYHDEEVDLLSSLEERAKELACLYRVEEILRDLERPLGEVLELIVRSLPEGWQFPELCQARIQLDGHIHPTTGFLKSAWGLCAAISVQDQVAGEICVHYSEDVPSGEDGPFLPQELKLIETIADRIGHFVLHQRLRAAYAVPSRPG